MNSQEKLSKYACLNKDAYRLKKEKEDIRTPFFRDIDRIIYSLAYRRYENKTQVFSYIKNDHITNRMLHVQLVSKAARTIGRALNLNEDLIEAAALGHDLGHVPLGHVGESILNEISLANNNGYFNHNIHSVRTLMVLENNGAGCNLCIQTLDAIMTHNGEFLLGEYYPQNKSTQEFLEEYKKSYQDATIIKKLHPMTLEGCIVRICDIVAYIGKDIEDAILLNKLKREDIPDEITKVLGNNNRQIVNTIILDIIKNSKNKPYIKLSDDVYQAIKNLKDFNMQNIYQPANQKSEITKYRKMFNALFTKYMNDLHNNNQKSLIYQDFLNTMNAKYLKETTDVQKVIDFLAGMTDDYFFREYKGIEKK